MVLIGVLALSGCVPAWFADLTGQDRSTPTSEEVDAALEPYYRQVLVWNDCGGGAQCATAIAPLDSTAAAPSGRSSASAESSCGWKAAGWATSVGGRR